MARLARKPYPWKWREAGYTYPDFTSFKSVLEEEREALEKLMEESAALPPGQVVGAVLSWPVADGYAYYIVIKDNPLTLQHVPFGDSWQVDSIMIRGLRKADVLERLERQRQIKRIFKKEVPDEKDR